MVVEVDVILQGCNQHWHTQKNRHFLSKVAHKRNPSSPKKESLNEPVWGGLNEPLWGTLEWASLRGLKWATLRDAWMSHFEGDLNELNNNIKLIF